MPRMRRPRPIARAWTCGRTGIGMRAATAGLPMGGRPSNSLTPAWHKPADRAAKGARMNETMDPALDLDGDRLREECGVFGIFGHPDAAAITALGLHALQHRGQEAA